MARRGLILASLGAGAVAILPLVLVLVTGGMSPQQFARTGAGLPDPWTAVNLQQLVADPQTLLQPMLTTAAVAAVVCVTQTSSSLLAAYAFARLRIPAKQLLFGFTLVGYLVPPVVTFLSVYVVFAQLGLAGSFLSLVLPFALASPFAVLLLRQWIARLPAEMFDAAQLDGAGHLATIWRIVIPLSRPAVAAVVLATAVSSWNSYLWPRLVAGVRLPQVQVAIAELQTEHHSNWTLVMAAAGLSLVPPLIGVAVFGHHLVAGVDLGVAR
jgi:multiple sugar transport system permease protein